VAVVCPRYELPTNAMREVLPDCYPRQDVVFNLQRATLLVAALATGNRDAFPEAFGDRLHQPYRALKVPGMDEILRLRAPGLLGCTLSGAGPAMLVFHEKGSESVLEQVRRIFERAGEAADVMKVDIDDVGLRIT
jgi:homoserine kinase